MTLKRNLALLVFFTALLILAFFVRGGGDYSEVALVTSPYIYNFNVPGVLAESDSIVKSDSSYWWLNSGGVMNIRENSGSTNQGELPSLSKWRLRYRVSNPTDTDNGYHPQNIFRLVSRSVWLNFSQEAYFKVLKDNLSESYNRNISNGLFLMSRYVDHNNLYYTGLRVDGTAVIKKKRHGEYTTLAQEPVFESESEYHRDTNPSLIPKNRWLGVRSDIYTIDDAVRIVMYVDIENSGEWVEVLDVMDRGGATGSDPIYNQGYVGIRTDFMDAEFRDFKVSAI